MIGQMLLNAAASQSCNPDFIIHRTTCGKTESLEACGLVRHRGVVEVNEPSGKRATETINVRWDKPIYAVSEQDNAPEDVIEWNGTAWRVVQVKILSSTWKAVATRISTDAAKDCHETERVTGGNSPQFIQPIGRG